MSWLGRMATTFITQFIDHPAILKTLFHTVDQNAGPVEKTSVEALLCLFRDTKDTKYLDALIMGNYDANEDDRRTLNNIIRCTVNDSALGLNEGPYYKLLMECLTTGAVIQTKVISFLHWGSAAELYEHEVEPRQMTVEGNTTWDNVIISTFWDWLTLNAWKLFWFLHSPETQCQGWQSRCSALSVRHIQLKRDLYHYLAHHLNKPTKLAQLMERWQIFGPQEETCGYLDVEFKKTGSKQYVVENIEQRIVGLTHILHHTSVSLALIRAAMCYDPDKHVIVVLHMDHLTSVFIMAKDMATMHPDSGDYYENIEPDGPIQPANSTQKK